MVNMEKFEDTLILKNNNEEIIKNIELRNFIEYKLGKENFTKKDLENIDEIILDSKNIAGNYNQVYLEEISLFPFLKRISFRNVGISTKDMERLQNIKEIEFVNCELEEFENLKEINCLKLINSKVENFETIEKLTELRELHLINLKFNNYDILKKYKNLTKLVIKNIEDFSLSKIDFYIPIEYLSIENIESIDLNIISKYKKLNTISVDRKELENFKEEIEKLNHDGIKIMINDQYEY